MTEEHISQEFGLQKIKELNNHFIKEIDQNELTDELSEQKVFYDSKSY